MEEIFTITVPKNSIINFPNGNRLLLDKVPENAEELWKQGLREFTLKKDANDFLHKFSKEEINHLITVRTPIGHEGELSLMKAVLKEKSKAPGKEKPGKPAP